MTHIWFYRPWSEIWNLFSCNYGKKSEDQTSVLNKYRSAESEYWGCKVEAGDP